MQPAHIGLKLLTVISPPFASKESVSRNDYVGCGASSASFLDNTVTMAEASRIKKIAFNIRNLAANINYTATVWINNVASSLSATIIDGTINYKASATGDVGVSENDLVSVQITYSDTAGAISVGVAISLLIEVT